MTPEEQALLTDMTDALKAPGTRIELERNWNGQPCVRLFREGTTKGGNPKWERVGGVLFAEDEGATDHAAVLRDLAGMLEAGRG